MRDCDLIVIGAGISGMTAAISAARHGLKVTVVDQLGPGGQIINAEMIENLPGFPQGISGIELGPLLHEQAEAAGAELILDRVESLELAGALRVVRGDTETLRAPAIIIAAGSAQRHLGIPGEARLFGKGVSHCASCDGPFFRDKAVCVVGGGDSAVDEALVLAQHARRVTVFHRGTSLSAQQISIDRAESTGKIDFAFTRVIEEILGVEFVTGVCARDTDSGVSAVSEFAAVFVYVGLEPNTGFVRDIVALDATGHIETDIMMQSSVAGIFAAGDIRKNSVAQLAAAAGDGATAAIAALRYLKRAKN